MLTSLRRILGNGEKIAIGNKICIGIFSIFYILAIATLLVPSENKDTESANLAEYNKLKQEFETLVRQNASDPDIANLKIEIEKLQTKITEVDEKYLPYLTKLSERRKREIAKVKVKKKLEEDFKLQFSLWNGSHDKTVKYVKARMHNPKSFKHVETRYIDLSEQGYRIIVMHHRGTNLFNAVVTNSIRVKVDLDGNVIEVIETK